MNRTISAPRPFAPIPDQGNIVIVVTGAAGFVGFHICRALLAAGADVDGLDSLNAYYDVRLKHKRLEILNAKQGFRFIHCYISKPAEVRAAVDTNAIEVIIHLAAQAGVRHSIEAPFAYEEANLRGHLSMLELARAAPRLSHMLYASSSSVYGDRAEGPFRETDRCDHPNSLYAATKRSCELLSESYSRLYGIKQYGLRFFTIYGPWGRPDMAYWLFSEAICEGRPVQLFGEGLLRRDFTFVGDVAPAILAMTTQAPGDDAPHEIFNLGNSKTSSVLDLIGVIERNIGRTVPHILAPAQPGDVTSTCADITRARARFGFDPRVGIDVGIPQFLDWFKHYRQNID